MSQQNPIDDQETYADLVLTLSKKQKLINDIHYTKLVLNAIICANDKQKLDVLKGLLENTPEQILNHIYSNIEFYNGISYLDKLNIIVSLAKQLDKADIIDKILSFESKINYGGWLLSEIFVKNIDFISLNFIQKRINDLQEENGEFWLLSEKSSMIQNQLNNLFTLNYNFLNTLLNKINSNVSSIERYINSQTEFLELYNALKSNDEKSLNGEARYLLDKYIGNNQIKDLLEKWQVLYQNLIMLKEQGVNITLSHIDVVVTNELPIESAIQIAPSNTEGFNDDDFKEPNNQDKYERPVIGANNESHLIGYLDP